MSKHNRPWYIWFSLLSVMVLWVDIARSTLFSSKNRDLWPRALVFLFKLLLIYFIIPSYLMMIIGDIEPLKNVSSVLLHVPLLYLQGVYIAYRLSNWREENISHPLRSKRD